MFFNSFILLFFGAVIPCPKGYFSLNSIDCHSLLKCNEIKSLSLGDLVGFGAVKQIYKSSWNGFSVAVIFVNNVEYLNDFHHGLNLLIDLNPSKYVPILIGYCKENHVYVTKYYPLGSLIGFSNYVPENILENLKYRFKLCLNYIEIINYIHSLKDVPLVMCDTNTLNKTLEQYLLDDDKIILNDIDALTPVKSGGIICGKREITGHFAAPEQRWSYKERSFNHSLMKHYDEKTDIWKIPHVCSHLLGDAKAAVSVKFHLFPINKKCLQNDSFSRPRASEVLLYYKSIYNDIFIKDEL
ncbi:Protein O-mannose kinase [Armadillidium nasatum]|uniref:Protein O-mannose kinase n=1 Tax=Armadillidium nasatum TaxID=96803 RepID=A0A5N5TKC7_9CRUS|nr:Protein O-mannose kinase [Armadillidium nasatum]